MNGCKQNRTGMYWTLEEVNGRLMQKMVSATEKIWKLSQDKSIPLRTAAYLQAIKIIGDAIESKGTKDYYIGGGTSKK